MAACDWLPIDRVGAVVDADDAENLEALYSAEPLAQAATSSLAGYDGWPAACHQLSKVAKPQKSERG